MNFVASLTVILPLASFLLSVFVPSSKNKNAQYICCVAVFLSAVLSLIMLYKVNLMGESYESVRLFKWFDFDGLIGYWAVKIDSLSVLMMFIINTVSLVVHIYSLGYMAGDKDCKLFFAYLSLFTFSMLSLISAENFVQLFFGWEAVGLSSYLLIGFWYKKTSAWQAAIKAFVVNRVGDLGLIIAICLIYNVFGSVNFTDVFAQTELIQHGKIDFLGYEFHAVSVICFLLFIGAMGKSAQLGLHVWLPDAMEGPTPVSALIHAATMVTAGVFLLSRCSYLFEYAPSVLNIVVFIGGLTCIFAALVALVQTDIKKIIAYSTCSQLGYMFIACGVSAYPVAMYHLLTHAFFKALLFLCAGNIIYSMHHEQDIRRMGGLKDKLKFTFAFTLIGSLAISGIPPFAGYFSKDLIIESVYLSELGSAEFAFIVTNLVAFLTAFYSFRLLFLVFWPRTQNHDHGESEEEDNIKEAPSVMLKPLYILLCGAILLGLIGGGSLLGLHITGLGLETYTSEFWNDSIVVLVEKDLQSVEFYIKLLPTFLSGIGIYWAYMVYVKGKDFSYPRFIHNLFANKFYFDEIYDIVFVKSTRKLGNFLWKIADVIIIDGVFVNGICKVVKYISCGTRILYSGVVADYIITILLGVMLVIFWWYLKFDLLIGI